MSFLFKLLTFLSLANSFVACSKKDAAQTVDSSSTTEDPISSVETVDSASGGAIDVSGGSKAPTPPAPFEVQLVSNQGEVKVTSELSCEGVTSSSRSKQLTYQRVWFEANSLDGPWEAYSGLIADSGNTVLTSTHAHKFIKCRIRAIDEMGLATISSSLGTEIKDSVPVVQAVAFSTVEDTPVAVSISLGNGYVDDDLDGLISVTSGQAVGGTLGSWTCDNGICTNLFTPSLNLNGNGTFEYTVNTSYSSFSTPALATVVVTPVNDAPILQLVADQVVLEDQSLSIPIFMSDVDNSLDCGTSISYISSQPSKIAASGGVVFSGTWPNCQANILPSLNANGSVSISLFVTDGELSTSQSFNVSIAPVNDIPVISSIADRKFDEDSVLSGVSFSISDVDDTLSCITSVSISSSNTDLLPLSAISLSGTAPNCLLSMSPLANLSGNSLINVTVADSAGATASSLFQVVVNSVNDAPTVAFIADQMTLEDHSVAVPMSIGDIDSTLVCTTSLSYTSSDLSVVSASGGVSFSGTWPNCSALITPNPNAFGSAAITVIVTDGSLAASRSFQLTVSPVNDLPVISSITDKNVTESSTLSAVSFSISDVDDVLNCQSSVSISSSNTSLLPVSGIVLTGTAPNCFVSLSPTFNTYGNSQVILTVTDSSGSSSSSSFELVVESVNDAPTIDVIPDQVVIEDQMVNVPISISDIDSALDCMTSLSYTSGNSSLVSSTGGIAFTGTWPNCSANISPALNAFGLAGITITVSDGTLTASRSFNLSVTSVNDVPLISTISDKSVNEDITLAGVTFTISDVEDSLNCQTSVSITSSNSTLLPVSGMILSGTAPNCLLDLAPASNLSGSSQINVTVADSSGATSSSAFQVTVNSVNDAPTIQAISAQVVSEDQTLTIPVSIADVDSALVCTTSLSYTSNNYSIVSSTGAVAFTGTWPNCFANISPALNAFGNADLTFTVTDGSLTGSRTFNLTVVSVNDAPVISSISDKTINEDSSLTGVAFTITDVDSTLNCASSVTVASSDSSLIPVGNIVVTGSAPNCLMSVSPAANLNGSSQITLAVSDTLGLWSSSYFQLTVNSVNDAPILAPISDQVVSEDQSVSFPISITDIDSVLSCTTSLSYVSSSTAAVSASGGVVFSGAWPNCFANISPNLNAFGSVSITLTVSDGFLTSSKSFNLSITPVNDLPVISDIVNQSTNEDTNLSGISFTIVDIDGPLNCSTSVTAASSNSVLLPLGNIQVTGTAPNCLLSLSPAANQFGTSTVTLTITDDSSGNASDSFTLNVASVNDNPTVPAGVAVLAAQGLQVGKTISCSGTSTDVDGDTLTYVSSFQTSASATGPWANAAGTVNGSGSLVIGVADAHNFIRCTRTVTDGNGGIASDVSSSVQILDADVIANNMTISGVEDTGMVLTIKSGAGLGYLDADGDVATGISVDLLSSGILDGAFSCNGSGVCTVNYTPASNFNGVATFMFTVTTAYGTSDSKMFSINISAVNDAPILVGTSNIPLEKSQPYSLAMNATDVDGDALTASCRAQCPTGLSFTGTTLNWTPAEADLGSRTITIRVTDSGGLYSENSFSFTVVDTVPPVAPTLTSMSVIPPANNLIFNLLGTAEANATVKIFKSNNCTGSPLLSLPSATFNTSGAEISLTVHEIYTQYSALSEDSSSNSSACSASLSYIRQATSLAQFNGSEGSSLPDKAVEHLGKFYFAADNFIAGRELWVFDPATQTSSLVADLEPAGSSSPTNLVSIGSYLYFSANTNSNGRELYRTDGTSAGTIRLADLCTGTCSSNPTLPVALNGKAYFGASTTTYGNELLVSDGTTGGTTLVKDIRSGTSSSTPLFITEINGKLWMQATGATGGIELYTSNGTAAGTTFVLDINTTSNSSPQAFAPVTGGVVFQATTVANGAELWFSDGTAAGTVLVMDIGPGTVSSTPSNMVPLNGKVYFAATTTATGRELWVTDGTASGTSMVLDINAGTASGSPTTIIPALGKLFFQATTAAAGQEPWISDGTAAGTFLLKDIRAGTTGSVPTNFAATSNRIYMSADTLSNRELWVSDGTSAGTIQYDIYSGSSGFTGSTYWITATSFGALFQGTNATVGSELFQFKESNSTASLASNIALPGAIVPKSLVMMNGVAYFVADDGINGSELWAYNGTSANMVLDICPGSCSSSITSLIAYGSKLYFAATTTASGNEPWVSDGTAAGTFMLSNLSTTTGSSSPSGFVGMGSSVYFVATSSAAGKELYKTDGTTAGTVIVKDIRSGTASSSPTNPVVAGSTLYFQANDLTYGAELWKSDGTSAGTVLVSDFVAGSGSSSPVNITALGSKVVFGATTTAAGVELFVSDGSTVSLVSDLVAGTGSSSPANFTVFGGKAYFTATTTATGVELFVTDGTTAGTSLVKDIYSGTSSSSPSSLVATSTAIYFRATTATQGTEIWKSDGTSAGTVLVKDIAAGTLSSTPSSLVALGDSVYFTANDASNGFDLYQIRGTDTIRVFDNISQTVTVPSFVEGAGRVYFFGTVGAGVPALLSW
ncbi:MAG: ELWxxDGT repeat protein [Pseudomonadota bacterium]